MKQIYRPGICLLLDALRMEHPYAHIPYPTSVPTLPNEVPTIPLEPWLERLVQHLRLTVPASALSLPRIVRTARPDPHTGLRQALVYATRRMLIVITTERVTAQLFVQPTQRRNVYASCLSAARRDVALSLTCHGPGTYWHLALHTPHLKTAFTRDQGSLKFAAIPGILDVVDLFARTALSTVTRTNSPSALNATSALSIAVLAARSRLTNSPQAAVRNPDVVRRIEGRLDKLVKQCDTLMPQYMKLATLTEQLQRAA